MAVNDPKAALEESNWGELGKAEDLRAKQLANEDFKAKMDLRRAFAFLIFRVMVGWLIFVGIILVASGSGFKNFKLADSVLSMLLGTTSVNVIGLMATVLTGLFPTKPSVKKNK